MKFLIIPFYLWIFAAVASGQALRPVISARSFSGQFIAREAKERFSGGFAPTATRAAMGGTMAYVVTAPSTASKDLIDTVPLEPALLVVSCERIKELFLIDLGMRDDWRGRIDVVIDKTMTQEADPSLTAVHSLDGWNYELRLPKMVRPQILVRAVIQTLLTELANRGGEGRATEIPFWLVDGMSAHLQAYNLPTFIIRPNMQSAGIQKLSIEGLEEVRKTLREHQPLTFQQMSWPDRSSASGKSAAVYRSCSQLLFEDLVGLKDGKACFQRMFQEMPKYLNWQTAFLLGFKPHFKSLLEVEKWWGLNCVSFTSSDLTGPQTAQECLHRLQNSLDVPVEVRLAPSREPTEARITLQEVIAQWEMPPARAAVERAAHDLEALQWFDYKCDLNVTASEALAPQLREAKERQNLKLHILQEISPLIVNYRTLLLNYLRQTAPEATTPTGERFHYMNLVVLKKQTVRDLNALDQQREGIRARLLAVTGKTNLKGQETMADNAIQK